jgi:HAD superfamily hydrolase (TIGR01509 family)
MREFSRSRLTPHASDRLIKGTIHHHDKSSHFDRNNVLIEYDFAYAKNYFDRCCRSPFLNWATAGKPGAKPPAFRLTPPPKSSSGLAFGSGLAKNMGWERPFAANSTPSATATYSSPLPDARPTLQALREKGLQIGVLSNFPLATIESSLEAVNLLDLVDTALSSTNIGVAKPNPEAYRCIAQTMQFAYAEALFIDDTPVHVQAARQLGMHAYLLDRQQTSHDPAAGVIRDLSILPGLCLP